MASETRSSHSRIMGQRQQERGTSDESRYGPYDPARSLHHLKRRLADPGPFYASLPRPLYWDWTLQSWVCTGYDEAELILGDTRSFGSGRLRPDEELVDRGLDEMVPLNALLRAQMLFDDGVEHERLKRLLLPFFQPRALAALRDHIQTMVFDLIAPHRSVGRMDLVSDFAGRLPTLLSAHLLGLPPGEEQLARWMAWNSAFEALLASFHSLHPGLAAREVREAMAEEAAYLRAEVQRRRDLPAAVLSGRPDLLSAMVRAGMSDEAIVANGVVLLAGGYKTATQLIARAIAHLRRSPTDQALLVEQPALIDDVLRETERLDGSSQFVGRRALVDCTLGGCSIRRGEGVIVLLGAANRDPRRFSHPDRFDIRRPFRKHLGFGFGAHYCWGAALAMLEAKVAVAAYLDAFPQVQAPPDDAWTWGPDPNVRCPSSVPVLLTPATRPIVPTGTTGRAHGMRVTEDNGRDERTTLGDAARRVGGRATDVPSQDGAGDAISRGEHNGANGDTVPRAWKGARAPFVPRCLHHLVEEQVERSPDAPALREGDVTLTYRQLDERANRLARLLQTEGVAPETVVGVCMDRSMEAIVALLAILKAGGAYVPLDPAAPDRLRGVLLDSRAAIVLTQESLLARLPDMGTVRVLALETLDARLAAERGDAPDSGATADNPAYIIYTSGSTGAPKGVEIRHDGVANLVLAQRMFDLGPGDRVLQAASLCFDASVFEVVLALCSGAALCLAPARSGPALHRFLRSEGITALVLTPTVLAVTPADALPSLRVVMAAGETCSAAVVRRWAGPGRRFYNLYGPTEATVWATAALCEADGRPPTIGRPIVNKEVHILDEDGRPVAVGSVGALYIGGVGLLRGYRGDPERTRRALVPHPFDDDPRARLYNTGDRACWTPDGDIDFKGRADERIKVHGVLVELAEVDAALASAPGVRAAAAVHRDDRLAAFVVPGPGYDERELRTHLARLLLPAMIPSLVVTLDALPRQETSDKVDRAALGACPLPLPETGRRTAPAADSGDPLEARIARLYAEVLRRTDVGAETHFFLSGGDSLLSLELTLAIDEHLHVALGETDLYDHPTVRQMAAYIRSRRGDRRAPDDRAARDNHAGGGGRAEGAWIVRPRPRANPAARLICLPEAGAGASLYYPWERHLPAQESEAVELCIWQLPGREERWRDMPHTRLAPLVEALVADLRPVLDRPFALFGHSLGGLLAFELTRALRREGLPLPLRLYLSGCRAPQLPEPHPDIFRLADDEFLALLRELGGIPPDILEDPARVGRLLPLLRADFSVVGTYVYALEPPLPVALSIWGGRDDDVFDAESLLAWRHQTEMECALHLLPGGHFFLHEPHACRRLVSALGDDVLRLVRSAQA